MNSINVTFSNGYEYTCGLFQSIFDITLFGGTLYAQFDLDHLGEYELNYLPEQALTDLRLIRSLTDAENRMPYSTFETIDDDNYWKSQASFIHIWKPSDLLVTLTKLSELCNYHKLPLPNFTEYSSDEEGVSHLHNDCWDMVCKTYHDPYESEKCRDYVLGVCIHHMLSNCTDTLSASLC